MKEVNKLYLNAQIKEKYWCWRWMTKNLYSYNFVLLYLESSISWNLPVQVNLQICPLYISAAGAKSFSVRADYIILSLKCKKLGSCFLSNQHHKVFECVMIERIFPCLLEINFSVWLRAQDTSNYFPSPPHSTWLSYSNRLSLRAC